MLKKGNPMGVWPLIAGLLLALTAANHATTCLAAGGDYYPEVEFDPELQAIFQKGMAARETGDLSVAVEAFQTVLSNQPMLHRARLEMAVAYYQAYNFAEAIQQAQQVLKDPKTPANVRVTILAFLAQVKTDAQKAAQVEHQWRFPVSVSYLYDTNVNGGPDAETIGRANLNPISEEVSDSGTVVSAGVRHTLQTGERICFGQQNAAFLWQSGVNVYQRNYFDEHKFDLDVYSLHTGPTFISRGKWRANLSVQGDHIRYGENDLATYTYLLPAVTFHLTDALELTLDGVANQRDFLRDADEGRDSTYLAGRISSGLTFGKDRFGVQAGIQYFNEDADAAFYSNEGVEVFAGANLRLLGKTNLFALVSQREERHDGSAPYTIFTNPAYNIVRDDTERRYTAGINHTLQDAGWLTDWKIEAKVIYTKLESNIDPFDYDRTQSFLTLARTFK